MRKLTNMDYSKGMRLYKLMKTRGHNVRLVSHDKEVHIFLNDTYLDTFDKKDVEKRGWQYI